MLSWKGQDITDALEELKKIGELFNVNFTISISLDEKRYSGNVKRKHYRFLIDQKKFSVCTEEKSCPDKDQAYAFFLRTAFSMPDIPADWRQVSVFLSIPDPSEEGKKIETAYRYKNVDDS